MVMDWVHCKAKDIVGEMVAVVEAGVSMYSNVQGISAICIY